MLRLLRHCHCMVDEKPNVKEHMQWRDTAGGGGSSEQDGSNFRGDGVPRAASAAAACARVQYVVPASLKSTCIWIVCPGTMLSASFRRPSEARSSSTYMPSLGSTAPAAAVSDGPSIPGPVPVPAALRMTWTSRYTFKSAAILQRGSYCGSLHAEAATWSYLQMQVEGHTAGVPACHEMRSRCKVAL